MVKPIDWTGTWTLDDYIISLFKNKATESVEFKAMLRIYGRDRLVKVWEEYKATGGKHHEHHTTRPQKDEIENPKGD